MGFFGGLQKMVVTAYSNGKFTKKVGKPFTVCINPDKYTHDYHICYSKTQAQGSSGASPNFNKVGDENVKFELVFDGTGVVPSAVPGVLPQTSDGIAGQIAAFKALAFNYNGNTHSPNFIELNWGTLLFKCRLKSLDISYTLFKPDGTPLRARANVAFVGYTDEVELAKKANNSSPDLSHLVTVKSGDTLPLMCADIYGQSGYYLQVAAVNQLSDFRNLVIGSELIFPPLAGANP